MLKEILDDEDKLPKNYLEGLTKVCEEKDYAFMITDNMFAILQHQMNCILEPLEAIMQTTLAMGVQKRSPYRGIINNKYLSISYYIILVFRYKFISKMTRLLLLFFTAFK